MEVETPEVFAFLYDPPLGDVRWRVAHGGRDGAKSWNFARALLVKAAAQPLRIGCFREYQNSIRESVHHLLAEQVSRLGLGGFYRVGQSEITAPNGSEFIFRGVRRDPMQLKSLEGLDLAWVEEAQAFSTESWQTLEPTIRKEGSEIWVSFNPGEASDPTYRKFIAEPPDRAIIRKITWRDNPFLSQVSRDGIAEMQRRDPEGFAHVYEGDPWSRSDLQVLSGLTTIEAFDPSEDWDGPYYGADWGFSQDPTILMKVWRHADRLLVEWEAGGVGLNMDQTADVFATVPGAKDHLIRADNARPETINELKRREFRIVGAPKWAGSVEDGVAHFKGYSQIAIHPRCTRAISEARLWRYATNAAGDILPKLVDAHNHTWDAIRYALAPLIRRRRRPQLLVTGG